VERGAALADERRRGGAPRSPADGGSKGTARSPAGDDIKGRTGRVEGGGRWETRGGRGRQGKGKTRERGDSPIPTNTELGGSVLG
jgi:hypothetical protein